MGPAIRSMKILKKITDDGMSIARLNFSHGMLCDHKQDINLIKTLNKKYKKNVKILVDLEGHRIRVGKIENNEIKLKKNQKLVITNEKIIGNDHIIPIDYVNSLTDIKEDLTIFIDDGNLALKVLSSKKNKLITKVQMDYILKSHKGVNIPGAELKFELFEEKDRNGMIFALKNNVDYIANSFVRDISDMEPLIDILKKEKNKSCKLIAKIEDILGIENINRILGIVDGLMVARGDLGISIPLWSVPIMQKYIIKKCNEHKKFVITATQMLESMINNSMPTRAEVSDVANAVLDGTDYTMLSAESSIGKYPEKAVRMMRNIIVYTEKNKYKLLEK
jgi:pyruvate kinase